MYPQDALIPGTPGVYLYSQCSCYQHNSEGKVSTIWLIRSSRLLSAVMGLFQLALIQMYTAAGIISQHPTKIDILVFRPRDHPIGLPEIRVSLVKTELIQRLKMEFDEYEEIFGTPDVMALLDGTSCTTSTTRVGSMPTVPQSHTASLANVTTSTVAPRIRLVAVAKAQILIKDLRPVKPLPLRFKPLISLTPTW
jgi:hypothetical protein